MKRALFAPILISVALVGWREGTAPQAQSKSAVLDVERLLSDLRVLAADDMQGREVGTPGGAKARAYAIERFRASGIAPFGTSYEQPFTFKNARDGGAERKGVNVIGHIDGSKEPRRYIVVSAHYDHLGVKNSQVFNGANDNASGTAALFAIGRHFAERQPVHSLILAAFDAEESGLAGSRAFVRQPPVDAAAIAVNLNADMLGREAHNTLYAAGTYLQPFLKPFVTRVAAVAPVKLIAGHDDPAARNVEDWTRQSDHYAFVEAKIPALYFGVEDFAHIHLADDKFDTITTEFYVHAVETLILAVKDFDANLDALPKR